MTIALAVLLGLIFWRSQLVGGATWDESADIAGTVQQLDVAGRWLAGDRNAHFSQVESNWAFYGIVAVLPAILARIVADRLSSVEDNPRMNSTYEGYAGYSGTAYVNRVASYALHATAFVCYLLTLFLCHRIFIRTTGKQLAAAIGATLLAFYPLWLGQSFFDHKDVPTAAFATMALYAAICIMQANGERRAIAKSVSVLAAATVLIGGIKIAALALILPSWIAASYALIRGRHFGGLLTMPVASVLGILLFTPVAWSDPLNFFIATIEQMARHPWDGCTLSAGYCIQPHSPEWSAWRYLLAWFLAQTPVLIGIGAAAAIITAPRRGAIAMTIAASATLPLIIIISRNATIYDGLRHVLFEIPLIFILGVIFWSEFANRAGASIVGIFAAIQLCLFIWDDIAMFPYNYIYFNLPSRQIANQYNFVTDYWGFSLKEASELPTVVQSKSTIVLGYPPHLVEPFVEGGKVTFDLMRDNHLPPATDYLTVAYVRYPPFPSWCSNPEYVTRQLPLGGWPLRLSYAARCVTQ